ncbi:small integral membrane protein 34A [Microtus oregoni]|uniref:small integral membrane protein 34A n=1 Tax=Microtus oregoni TaxID=111838 RepID=UPI001BB1CB7F|nr:small integral membrane protein 34A [Microtus oregoni]
MSIGSHFAHRKPPKAVLSTRSSTLSPGHCLIWPFCFPVIKWKPQDAFNQTQPSSSFLRDPVEGRNSTNSTRTLRLSDAASATWYILAIIGIYGVIFVFRLASNILRRNERSLEDIYYSNLTSELKRKGFQSKVAKCSLIIHNTAALQPQQDDPEPKGENGRLHTGTQAVP